MMTQDLTSYMVIERKLERYREIWDEANEILELTQKLQQEATSVHSIVITGMPMASDGLNHSADKVTAFLDTQRRYATMLKRSWDELEEIEDMIEWLEPLQRQALRRHYIAGETWGEVAINMGYSEQRIYQIRAEAMTSLYDLYAEGKIRVN